MLELFFLSIKRKNRHSKCQISHVSYLDRLYGGPMEKAFNICGETG